MITLEELTYLPEALVKELRITQSKELDLKIYAFIKENETASINQIMVHLYNQEGVILKRTQLVGRLYRMQKRGQIEPVQSRKGVYRISKDKGNE